MPTGVLIECAAVLVGGAAGALLGKRLPQRICEVLNLMFSLSALSMGIVSVVKVSALPPVILSVLLGTVLGELCRLEAGIAAGFGRLNAFLGRHCRLFSDKGRPKDYMSRFVSIVVLFCMSGTGIFGALQAGISGDNTILFTKAILDLFTAAVFAASLGFMVSLISLPQLVILGVLFYGAAVIMPLVSEGMLADFTACGGILMLATGFRIMGIKNFPVASMIPSMALVMPLSALWACLPGVS